MNPVAPAIVTIAGTRQTDTLPAADVASWRAVADLVHSVTCLWAGPDLTLDEPGFAIRRSPRKTGIRSLAWVAKVTHRGRRAVRSSSSPAVLNGAEPWAWLSAWLISRSTDTPWIMDIHASYLDLPASSVGRARSAILKRSVMFFASRATARRAVSFAMAESLERAGLATHWIPPRLLPLWEAPIARRMERRLVGPTRFVAIGRMVPSKGFDLLLEAMAAHGVPGGAHLTIIGDGPERAALHRLTVDLGLVASVTFTGSLTPQEVREELIGSDVFVLSSRDEGLPRTLLEAASCGVGIIATDVGGVRHASQDWETVDIVPVECGALADAMKRAIAHPAASQDLDVVRHAVLERYGFRTNIQELAAMYTAVIRSGIDGATQAAIAGRN